MTNTVNQNELIEAIIYTFIAFMLMSMVLILFFYFSRKKLVQKEIENKNLLVAHQKDLLRAVVDTQEEERKRIAQDLHDDISSKLNVVALNTHILQSPGMVKNDWDDITNNIINYTQKALESSRRIAHDLLPPVLEKFGLDAAIKELCLDYNSSKATSIYYQNELSFNTITVKNQLHLFRILQELINNSVRHGKAKQITIAFTSNNNKYHCYYADDGVGFNIQEARYKKGLGMKNIEGRVGLINGTYTISSVINKGVTVNIQF